MNILSDEDLRNLTGASQHGKQKDVLSRNGIYYIERLDGSIVTTWFHVNHPCGAQAKNDSEPNFGAMGNG